MQGMTPQQQQQYMQQYMVNIDSTFTIISQCS